MAEKKYFNTRINYLTGNNQANFNCLSLVPQGADTVNRVGTRCLGTSLEFMYFTRHNPPNGVDPVFIINVLYRLTIFIWKDDVPPTIGTLFDAIAVPQAAQNPMRPFNKEYQVKRKILYDKLYYMSGEYDDNNTFFTINSGPRCGKIVIPLSKLKNRLNEINFQPASTAATNHIYVCTMTNDYTSGTNLPVITTMHTRYNFIDF